MYTKRLVLENFRNISFADIEFSEGVNILYGDNAQGKTNIIEALWLFSACKSFRNSTEKDFLKIGSEKGKIITDFYKNERKFIAKIDFVIDKRKEIFKNNIKVKPNEIIGDFNSVLFFPEHLNLIKGGPDIRRRFMDFAISQIKPRYFAAINEYNKILFQRNFILKSKRKDLLETLEIWDMKLAKVGALIVLTRKSYIEKVILYAKDIMNEISAEKEHFDINFISFDDIDGKSISEIEESLLIKIKESLQNDLRLKCSTVGPHRDDFLISLNSLPAKSFASQGQQRSCVMALKLAEAEILNELTGEYPIMLFDDVFSELDSKRKLYITEKIKNKQVIITTCENMDLFNEAKLFNIKNGEVFV